MKLPLLFIFCFILIQHSECSYKDWYTSLTNKVHKVHNTIGSFFGRQMNKSIDVLESIEDELTTAENKFRHYVDGALATGKTIFDTITPQDNDSHNAKPQCVDGNLTNYYSTPQLIALHGYSSESHTIVTDDGYILTVHRIPNKKNTANKTAKQKTALLHHGILGSSADWILAGPDKSLPYILSDAGYDVWLSNVRGNTYSRAHVSRNVDSFEFWNFTFHDVSQHDLPAVIDYILETKGRDAEINYIGYSMGTTALFGLLSTKPQYNQILRAGFALAPIVYMSNIRSPIKYIAKFSNSIESILKLFDANEFFPQTAVLRWMSKYSCDISHYAEFLCENSMFLLCAYNVKQFDKSLLPQIMGHVPAGASTKTLVHYAQEIHSGKFQLFDYGTEGNFKEYGTATPPEYPVNKITLPIALVSAKDDWLASEVDAWKLYGQLVNPIEHYVVPLKEFNHIDFLWALDAPNLVYAKVMELIEKDNYGTSKVDDDLNSI